MLMSKNSRAYSLVIRIACLSLVTTVFLGVSFFTTNSVTNNKNISPQAIHSNRKLLTLTDLEFNIEQHASPLLQFFQSLRRFDGLFKNKKIQNCTPPAILEFPPDGLSKNERQMGWIVVHFLLALYCFWFLAIVCDEYFIPAIEYICQRWNIRKDVAGATLMAASTSSPELFINCVGTFVTKGDLGVGAIVGASVINILAVPACCGLFVRRITVLSWWPLTRDCIVYAISVVTLIVIFNDNEIKWYEAMILVLMYVAYIFGMFFNDELSDHAHNLVAWVQRKRRNMNIYKEVTEFTPLITKGDVENNLTELDDCTPASSPWTKPDTESHFMFYMKWPISFILWYTIPDCRKSPRLSYVVFFICILWNAITSYVIAFFITIIGDTLNIPDSVMGLTFLAVGTSIPESVSSVIVTAKGYGAMGISNAIGSNTFDILLGLGLPWLIKAIFLPDTPGKHIISINSTGLTYSVCTLLSSLVALYTAFAFNKFRLDWKVGVTCFVMYFAYLVFACLLELNVFFPVNLPTCQH